MTDNKSSAPVRDAGWLRAVDAQIAELLENARGNRLLARDLNTPEAFEDGLENSARLAEDSADMLADAKLRIANTLNRRGDVESALHLALVETVCELRACLAGENDLGDTPAVIEKAEAAIAAMDDDGLSEEKED